MSSLLGRQWIEFWKNWPKVFAYTIVDYGVYTSFGYSFSSANLEKLSTNQIYQQISLTCKVSDKLVCNCRNKETIQKWNPIVQCE